MGKMLTVIAATASLALFAAWAATPNKVDTASVAVPGTVDVTQLTLQAKDLPAEEFPAF